MPRLMISYPAGQSSRLDALTTNPGGGGTFTGIPLEQEATVCQVLLRDASSSISQDGHIMTQSLSQVG